MSQFKWDRDKILEATNGGLDILIRLYPEADKKGGKFPHFRTHDEDHGSSIIFKTREGFYIIKNFGGGDDMTPFDAVMLKYNLNFADALKWVAAEFKLEGQDTYFGQAKIEVKPATKGQKDGEYHFKYRNKLSDFELKTLGPLVTNKLAIEFDLKSCDYFIQVKQYHNHPKYGDKLMQIVTKSTETYPILVFDKGDWQKIYQPLNRDKGFRFRYAGDKLPHYLFGRELIEEYYQPLPDGFNEHDKAEYEGKYGKDGDNDPRADVIIIAGGDRDSLNVASLDYPVVWKNSETEPLSYEQYEFLKNRCKKLCYLGDLDATGIQETVSIAMQYLDINIIWLPEWLKERKYRGKAQKDMTDYCKAVYDEKQPGKLASQFKTLVADALPARFWDQKYDHNGNFKGYGFNNEACYRFLKYNGFYRFEEDYSKEDFSFIRVDQNIVKRVPAHHISNYPGEFISNRKKGKIELLNFIHRSAQLSKDKLSKMEVLDPDFSGSNGRDFQCFFFKNKIWKVTPEEIIVSKYGHIDINVWEDKIIPHEVNLNQDRIFTITKDDGVYDIEIHKTDNHFFNFLINTSRIHWRVCGDKPFKDRIAAIKEQDAEKRKQLVREVWADRDRYRQENLYNIAEAGLPEQLVQEQKLNLINKIFAFGYALHRYKVGSKAWSGFAMDNRISDISDSNGGSGKSIVWHKALIEVLPKYKYVNGGDPDTAKDKFLYDGIDRDTDTVIFDDLDKMFPMRKVYNNVTGEFNINPKFGKPFSLKFSESPKCFFTSNFGIYGNDSSTMRRLLITVFADYYHHTSDDDSTAWSFRDEMGFDLFTDFNSNQWDDYFNFCAQACQFQLATDEKINPPMENVNKRNSLTNFGDAFKDWADNYFELRKNRLVVKSEAMESLQKEGNLKGYTSQRFKKALKEWTKYYGYELNPQEVLNTQGHCKHSINGKTQECVCIKTDPNVIINLSTSVGTVENPENVDFEDKDFDDVPY